MIYLLAGVFLLSFLLTAILRQQALSKKIIDIPNVRSSHTLPTPRGGGLAFVICFLATNPFLVYFDMMSFDVSMACMGPGMLIASLGFVDDYKNIAIVWRLTGQIMASSLAVYLLSGMPQIYIFAWECKTGLLMNCCAVLLLTWCINFYNFMDGIDGLASIEALTVCISIAIIYIIVALDNLVILPLILAAAIGGFFYWNKPPARIFMGDVGSGFLGFIFGVMSIYATTLNNQLIWCWFILLGIFVVDATLTLLYRLIKGEKIYQAHCAHAYQHLARKLDSHVLVTFFVFFINMIWLLPMAVLVANEFIDGALGLIIAYVPLVILFVYLNIKKEPLR